jgi:hypothetical protein
MNRAEYICDPIHAHGFYMTYDTPINHKFYNA